jgi:hypothetical protein
MSYAVVWSDNGTPPRAGRLELAGPALELHGGRADGDTKPLVVEGGAIAAAYAVNRDGDRLNGCPTIVLERHDGTKVRIGALEFGIIGELRDLVATLPASSSAAERVLVALPLREGCAERASELIGAGRRLIPRALVSPDTRSS